MTDTTDETVDQPLAPHRGPGDARPGRVRAAVGAFAVVAAALGLVLALRIGEDPNQVDSALLGRPAPTFTLDRLDGEGEVALADLRGRVVIVNFFASWCAPCRAEHAELVATARRYEPLGVDILGIATDDDPDAARAFLAEVGGPAPTPGYTALDATSTPVAVDYGLFGIPETFVIDATGTVVRTFTGPVTADILADAIDTAFAPR